MKVLYRKKKGTRENAAFKKGSTRGGDPKTDRGKKLTRGTWKDLGLCRKRGKRRRGNMTESRPRKRSLQRYGKRLVQKDSGEPGWVHWRRPGKKKPKKERRTKGRKFFREKGNGKKINFKA